MLCSRTQAWLPVFREISAVAPEIALFSTTGISRGSLGTEKRTRIRIVNRYNTTITPARNRVMLLIITDADNIISTEANNVMGVIAIYLPFWRLRVRIVLDASCLKLQSSRYTAGSPAATAINCIDVRVTLPDSKGTEDSRPWLLRFCRNASSSKGNTNRIITVITILSLG